MVELHVTIGPKEQGSEGYWRGFRMASSETQYGKYVGGDTRVEVCGASIVQAWSRRRHRAPEGPYKSARFLAPGAELMWRRWYAGSGQISQGRRAPHAIL